LTEPNNNKGKIMLPKLFVTDLDGTALDKSSQPYAVFPDHFSDFLDTLYEHKCEWAINTTWDVAGQSQLILSSTVKSEPQFIMAEFGARLATFNGATPEFVQPYTSAMEKRIDEFNETFIFDIYRDICLKFRPKRSLFYGHLFILTPVDEDRKALREFVESHTEEWKKSAVIDFSINENDIFSIWPKFLNKGLSLAEALKQGNVLPEEVVVAGDELMDLDMMTPELAKFAVCPENAVEQVKQRVLDMGCFVGRGVGGAGVIDSFKQLAEKENWEFDF
jgi:hydroxymethylpyrimidine pyrophosphatase-like HAD family hydrolase